MRTLILISLLGVAGCCCNQDKNEPATQPSEHAMTATSPGNHPVIVHIVSRDTTVSISAGPDGLLYSLSERDGTVLVADASGEQFEQLYPELYQRIRGPMKAQNDRAFLWDAVETSKAENEPIETWAGMELE